MSQAYSYHIWSCILNRCTNPSYAGFRYYGGAGVTICPEWKRSFATFYADVGPRPSAAHSLDRFPNNNGNYEPGNVRWATKKEQIDNRRSTLWVDLEGQNVTLADAARRLGLNYPAAHKRLKRTGTVMRRQD